MKTFTNRLLAAIMLLLFVFVPSLATAAPTVHAAADLSGLLVTLTVVLGTFTVLLTLVILLLVTGMKNGRLSIKI